MDTNSKSSVSQEPPPGPPPSPIDAIGPDHPGYLLIYEPRRRHSRWAVAAVAIGLLGLLLCAAGMGMAASRIEYFFEDSQRFAVMVYVYAAATARIGFGTVGLLTAVVAGCRKNRRRELVWIAAVLNLILLLSGGIALGYVPLLRTALA